MPVRHTHSRAALPMRVDELHLPRHQREWVSSVVGPTFTILQLDEYLEQHPGLDNAQQAILDGIRRGARGELRAADARSFRCDGFGTARDEPALQRKQGVAPDGDPALVQQVREQMQYLLVGQGPALGGFVRLARAFVSPAQRTPPALAVSGDPGHGKSQAIKGFARSLLGENPEVVEVDLSSATDRDWNGLFGEEGALELSKLQKLGRERVGLVWVSHAENLQQRAPKIATTLAERLAATPDDPDHAFVPYIFDFDGEEDPRLQVISALDSVGNRALSGLASFRHLDADAMLEYVDVLLPRLVDSEGLNNLRVEFDPRARAALGKALATPHAPLDELEARLRMFALDKIATQTSIDRSRGVVTFFLDPDYENDEAALKEKLETLHQEYASLFDGEDLFVALEVGVRDLDAEQREQQLAALEALPEELRAQMNSAFSPIPESEEVMEGLRAEVDQTLTALEQVCGGWVKQVRAGVNLGYLELPSAAERETFHADTLAFGELIDRCRQDILSWMMMQEMMPDAELPPNASEISTQALFEAVDTVARLREAVEALTGAPLQPAAG